jgi:hypothetical protein
MRKRWMAAGLAVGIAVAGGGTVSKAGAAPTPKASSVVLTSMVSAKAKPAALAIKITGRGRASDIVLDVNDQESQHTGSIALPKRYTNTNYAAVHHFPVVVSAQTGSGKASASITCTIWESGQQVAKQTATGPYSIATCEVAWP